MKVLRNTLRASLLAAVIALPAGTASAQSPLTPSISLGGEQKRLTPEERERQKAIDDAYKSATKKIPEQKTTNDPWADVRPASAPPASSTSGTASKSKQSTASKNKQ